MLYLVDTDRVISYLKGRGGAVKQLQHLEGKLCLSVISLAEILEGIYFFGEIRQKVLALNMFLTGVKILDVDYRVVDEFAKARVVLRKQGNLIDNMDLLIASTALAHKLTLITGNKKHFERVKGLRLFKGSFAD
ncbi:MAG: hypothetical protein A3H88_03060 [Candidatus Blackburnbacteria bacterium RIFCSPLOWO2_02_FULL_44_9]|uniref:Ribonuclease VapC n=1 Tax=Candidatus Blackburnbacteria bacterium RIFCSPHIGHO2_02_FULL_44_20 TaxID=1797516 RepID=A0A1G1V715_9BACT|nr:MAG: hypothetical protein A3B55_02610 [Candidatus Daviesbacteria bacterium RIFCSPLOWO2_01_FULL_43_15]OGY11127.1 MAG: hypothetical protein A3D26_02260 [Candidatus Blackburnbacteria bacterium RIFCSPHIGHO2_02_FULL_44_20]OGY17504.1 MAG: hypothetical protein A3H88_03060 [Candidatus Blackburnbacteria bacterium RIFCSPLOWO2_02_FULL_44_9]